MPLEEWERILAPFDIAELHYYGGPEGQDREHILCVLKGKALQNRALGVGRYRKAETPGTSRRSLQ